MIGADEMAETTTQTNNKAVQFQGKPTRERAPKSPIEEFRRKAASLMRRGVISKKQHDRLTGTEPT